MANPSPTAVPALMTSLTVSKTPVSTWVLCVTTDGSVTGTLKTAVGALNNIQGIDIHQKFINKDHLRTQS